MDCAARRPTPTCRTPSAFSRERFFEKFDRENLCLVYQEKTAAGEKSNFNKIVSRESAEAKGA